MNEEWILHTKDYFVVSWIDSHPTKYFPFSTFFFTREVKISLCLIDKNQLQGTVKEDCTVH